MSFAKPLFNQIDPARRATILKAATEEFAAQGLTQTTVAAIAARAGVSVGSLYQYFPDKDTLYLTVVQRGYELLDAAVSPIMATASDLGATLAALVDALFEHTRRHPAMTRLYLRFSAESDPALAGRLAETIESFTARGYAELVAAAQAAGELAADVDPRMVAFGVDSLLLTMQFSLAGAYHRDRLHIYLGPELADDEARLKAQFLALLRQTLGLRQHTSSAAEAP